MDDNIITCPFCLGCGNVDVIDFCEPCDGNGWITIPEYEAEVKERREKLLAEYHAMKREFMGEPPYSTPNTIEFTMAWRQRRW